MKWRKLISILLVCCMLTSLFPVSALERENQRETMLTVVENDPDSNDSVYDASDDAQVYALSKEVSGTCGESLTWTLTTDGTLTISGTGAMKLDGSDGSWKDYQTDIKAIVIKSGVTNIESDAFSQCSSLTNLVLCKDKKLIYI